MTAVYASPDQHAAWLLHNIASPLRGIVRVDLDRAHLMVSTLRREDLEAVALLFAAAADPSSDLVRQLRWLTEPVRHEHRDEWPESPRPLVVHRA